MLNVGTATAQDQFIVYLYSYLAGIGALYELRAVSTVYRLHVPAHAAESLEEALSGFGVMPILNEDVEHCELVAVGGPSG